MAMEKVGRFACASTLAFTYQYLATLVLLYSRLTGLINVFTFQYARSSSNLAPCASDPYLLPLANNELDVVNSKANFRGSDRSPKISAISLRAVKYNLRRGSTLSGLGQIYLEKDVTFYQLSLITNDLALSESLYAQVPKEFKAEVCAPNTVSRLKIAKTPAKILSDFIVPNGYVERDHEDSPHHRTNGKNLDAEIQASLTMFEQDPWTISFEWLEDEIHSPLTGASPTRAFDENLDLLQSEIEDKVALGVPTMETLCVNIMTYRRLLVLILSL